jgi:exodeoxyribonuclease-3
MKLFSWNVNGLRAVHRKGDWQRFLANHEFDILCLQETKADMEQLPEEVRQPDGMYAYFASSTVKRGYSGVAVYSKAEPESVEYGLGIERFDQEGRVIIAYFSDFVLYAVYFPNGGGGAERLQYKLDFYDAFLEHVKTQRAKGRSVIFCGDVNTAHEAIDLARPKENEKNTGFLPEERAWIDEVIASGFVDSFRHLYPDKEGMYSYWDMKTRARERNVGWRIDYFFVDASFQKRIRDVAIMQDVLGSDHCPVFLELS